MYFLLFFFAVSLIFFSLKFKNYTRLVLKVSEKEQEKVRKENEQNISGIQEKTFMIFNSMKQFKITVSLPLLLILSLVVQVYISKFFFTFTLLKKNKKR